MDKRDLQKVLLIGVLATSLFYLGSGLYIHAKAVLAQHLIKTSWHSAMLGKTQVKPWPWADSWPVCRLILEKYDIDVIVLAGDDGRALAFGPGYRFDSAAPGDNGNTIISGHRDTHFRFLRHLQIDDEIILQTASAELKRFRIVETSVLDTRHQVLQAVSD